MQLFALADFKKNNAKTVSVISASFINIDLKIIRNKKI